MSGFFLDPAHGWMVKRGNRLFRTADGGKNWQELPQPGEEITGVLFVTTSRGWAFGQQGLLRTADGGQSWGTAEDAPHLRSLGFADADFDPLTPSAP